MLVRRATPEDLDEIMRIYDTGRQTMRDNGNAVQWVNGYPSRADVREDIAREASYVIEGEDGRLHGVFMFAVCDDPTYHVIEDGAWLNDEPYGVIHRIASDGTLRGVLAAAVGFGEQRTGNLRVDTHESNAIMQGALKKAGFERCGIIYCYDGTPRIAFQKVVGA